MRLRNFHRVHIRSISEPASLFPNNDIVTAHLPLPHLAILGKRPVFQPVTPLPFHAIVCILILVPELHSDFVILETEELLAQAIVLLLLPLGGEEGMNFGMAGQEDVAIAPDGGGRVGFDDTIWVPGDTIN